MSEMPATLSDLAEVEARLDHAIERLKKTVEGDAKVTDEKFEGVRIAIEVVSVSLDLARNDIVGLGQAVRRLDRDVAELLRVWEVAKQNPELIRELALTALKEPP